MTAENIQFEHFGWLNLSLKSDCYLKVNWGFKSETPVHLLFEFYEENVLLYLILFKEKTIQIHVDTHWPPHQVNPHAVMYNPVQQLWHKYCPYRGDNVLLCIYLNKHLMNEVFEVVPFMFMRGAEHEKHL